MTRKLISIVLVFVMMTTLMLPTASAHSPIQGSEGQMHSGVRYMYVSMADKLFSHINESDMDEFMGIIRHELEIVKSISEKARELETVIEISEKKQIIHAILNDISNMYMTDVSEVKDYINHVAELLENDDVANALDLIDLFISNDFQEILDILKTYTFDISGFVFNDTNTDTIWSEGETGVSGQSVLVIPVTLIPQLIEELTPLLSQLENMDIANIVSNLGPLLQQVQSLGNIVHTTDMNGKFTARDQSMGFYLILRSPVALPFKDGSLDWLGLLDLSLDIEYEETGSVTNPYISQLLNFLPQLLDGLNSIASEIDLSGIDFDSLVGTSGINDITNMLTGGMGGIDLGGILNSIGGQIPGTYFALASPYGNLYTLNNGTFNIRPELLFSVRKLSVVTGYVFEDTDGKQQYNPGFLGLGSNGRNGVKVSLFEKTPDGGFAFVSETQTSAEGMLSFLGVGSPGAYGFILKYNKEYYIAINKTEGELPGGIMMVKPHNLGDDYHTFLDNYYVVSKIDTFSGEHTVFTDKNFWFRRLRTVGASVTPTNNEKFNYTLSNSATSAVTGQYRINGVTEVEFSIAAKPLIGNRNMPINGVQMQEGENVFEWRSHVLNADGDRVYSEWEMLKNTVYKITTTIERDDTLNGSDITDTASHLLTSGQNRTVRFTLAPGHMISSASINGEDYQVVNNQIIITRPVENKDIRVYIHPICYTVSSTVEGGTIEGSTEAVHDTDYTFTTSPNVGYDKGQPVVKAKIGTGTEKTLDPVDGIYTISGEEIIGNIDITVTYPINIYSVNLPTIQGATIEPVEEQETTVHHGNDFSFTVTLASNYNRSNIIVMANDIELDVDSDTNIYTITNISMDQNVSITGIRVNPTNSFTPYQPPALPNPGPPVDVIKEEIKTPGLSGVIPTDNNGINNKTKGEEIIILVNDQIITGGKVSDIRTSDGRSATTLVIDHSKVEQLLMENQQSEGKSLIIPYLGDSQMVTSVLRGETIRKMRELNQTIEVYVNGVSYILPAKSINIEKLIQKFNNQNVKLEDVEIDIVVGKPDNLQVQFLTNYTNNVTQMIIPPMEFDVIARYNGIEIKLDRFNVFIERLIPISDDIDLLKVTTGIVYNNDGTFNHVPTEIIEIDGKRYAKINSLTNSIYSVIYNEKTFEDVNGHWGEKYITDMANRLIVFGRTADNFVPSGDITRAEAIAIIVRAFGLERKSIGRDVFTDVSLTDWFYDVVYIAHDYGFIQGTTPTTFDPKRNITREEVFVILGQASKYAKNMKFTGDISLLESFSDSSMISDWAVESAAICVSNEIVRGDNNKLNPKTNITRAELATMVRRLLVNAKLINE